MPPRVGQLTDMHVAKQRVAPIDLATSCPYFPQVVPCSERRLQDDAPGRTSRLKRSLEDKP